MNFIDIKNVLYQSNEISNIVDHWSEGFPFLLFDDGWQDVFLYYSCDNIKGKFKELKLAILIDSNKGIIKTLDNKNLKEMFSIDDTFDYTPIPPICDYKKQLAAEDLYSKIRSAFLSEKIDEKDKTAFKQLIQIIIPKEIFNRVYYMIGKQFFDAIIK